jgi:hypothetical protein
MVSGEDVPNMPPAFPTSIIKSRLPESHRIPQRALPAQPSLPFTPSDSLLAQWWTMFLFSGFLNITGLNGYLYHLRNHVDNMNINIRINKYQIISIS